MALTTYERLRGVLAGVGNAGDRIMGHVTDMRRFEAHIPDGPERQMFNLILRGINDQANELQSKD